MASSREVSIDRREILRALGCFSVDELLEMKDEYKQRVSSNIHLENEAEVGRSSSSMLLQNPTITLDLIYHLLYKIGRLSPEEVTMWKASRPKTSVRFLMNPYSHNL